MAVPASELVGRLWGCGDLDAAFGMLAKVVAPWPRAPRTERGPDVRTLYTRQLLDGPVWLSEVDPRVLLASQGWVVRQHAEYYRSGEWERTGVTSADRESEANRFPIVVCDLRGRRIISTGHHRALVALIEGRPLLCRRAPDMPDAAIALLPRLLFGPSTRLDHVVCESVGAAVAAVRRGDTALCPDLDVVKTAALELSPSIPPHRLAAIDPPPPVVKPPVDDWRPPPHATGLCTTCGGLRSEVRTARDLECGDHCWCVPVPEGLTSAQRESGIPCVLCQVCHLEVLRGHTRWRTVVCNSCWPRAQLFNERVGRKVILRGIHSIVNGGPVLSMAGRTPSHAEFVGFANELNGMCATISVFSDWSRQKLLQRLRRLGFGPDQVIQLPTYLSACEQNGIDREVGWAELEADVRLGSLPARPCSDVDD